MNVADLVSALNRLAPLEFAESWDKVGLLAGDSSREIKGPVLLAIDLTEAVLDEAIKAKASAIIAYHPPIFEPLSRVTSATPRQRVIFRAIEAGIAIYSPHTALDAVKGGITDWLCEGISGSSSEGKIAGDCRALSPHAHRRRTQEVKIVTFVPTADADRIRNALASAGAGIIGNYQLCSFASEGTGTFLAGDGAKPTVGRPGQIESVREMRLEMVCSRSALALAIETLRQFHPYEEPPIDVFDLEPVPTRSAGAGRRLVLDRPATVRELAERLKTFLKRDRVRYALAERGPDGEPHDPPLTHVGVVPGAGESLSRLARAEQCQVFVTGEMKHHEVLGALNAGMSVILGGHTPTERGYLSRYSLQIQRELPGLHTIVSKADRDVLISL
ncbi:MAG: Nif3-like dinuclear metal center hexameric protein [Phycisphaerales bacterium]|nr:MAG: Nif3-like dinuclear metal center hexameric protein [Phycisphaerales bacterium]